MNNGHEQEHQRLNERQQRFQDQLEQIGSELKAFTTSQVLMGENLDKMAAHIQTLDGHIEKIDLRLLEATEKLDALINIVDHHARDAKRHN